MNSIRAPRFALAVLSATLAFACTKEKPPEVHGAVAVAVDAGAPEKTATVTFLVTGAENGYLLPTPDEGGARGGAAEVLGAWVANEKHCPGPLAQDGAASCPDAATVALSTGDNANGQAISSYFKGEPTAEVMNRMGYVASALGNRELDWPREQFLANAQKGGFPYLAANLAAKDDDGRKLGLMPSRLVTRAGVKVGVIGLAAKKAIVTPMPGRMIGLEAVSEEKAIYDAVKALRANGAVMVAVVSDGCLDEVPSWLEGHADWNIAFVAARQCDSPAPAAVGATKLVYPGRHFHSYAKVKVTVGVPSGSLVSVEPASVDVVAGPSAPPPEPKVKELIAAWKAKLDQALGDTIGFTKTGFEQESKEMASWLTGSLKERFKTDVALLNRKGVRQGLPEGKVAKASVYDLVPWDNQVVIAHVPGDALLAALGNVEARAAGVKPKDEGWVDAKGAAIDPKKTYSVATIDYLYLGGDGFQLAKADPKPEQTGVSWQTALIEWTQAKKTDEKKPLESVLP